MLPSNKSVEPQLLVATNVVPASEELELERFRGKGIVEAFEQSLIRG